MVLQIAVCDDELEAIDKEVELIREIFSERALKYELSTFQSPKELLSNYIIYDMVFLDIEMGDINGIELARRILKCKKDCFIFFLTNYSVYLDNAFDVNAIRYLTKPIDKKRLSSGIDNAIERMIASTKKIHLTNHVNKEEIDIEISTIIYITNTGRHARIISTQYDFVAEEIFTVVKENIEREVDYFAMPHQSYFVNLKYVNAHTMTAVYMSYAGKEYEAMMTRRRYKDFDRKVFRMAKVLK